MKYLLSFLLLLAACTATGAPAVELVASVDDIAVLAYDGDALVVTWTAQVDGEVRGTLTKLPIYSLHETGSGWRVKSRSLGIDVRGKLGEPVPLVAWGVVLAKLTPAEIARSGLVAPPTPQP